MTDEHSHHLHKIGVEFIQLLNDKYAKGVKEHGGKLWEKKGLIDMAIDEAIDQVVYLMTLKQQLEENNIELGDAEDEA